MDIEKMGNGSPEKEPKNIIAELEKSFQDWLKENPDLVEKIKSSLLHIFGYGEVEMTNEGMVIIKIPVAELSIFGTACGISNNKAFNQEVIDFLKEKEVEFVVAISDREIPEIQSAIIKINQEEGEVFSEMISENEGSLRRDSAKIEGWSTFESE